MICWTKVGVLVQCVLILACHYNDHHLEKLFGIKGDFRLIFHSEVTIDSWSQPLLGS